VTGFNVSTPAGAWAGMDNGDTNIIAMGFHTSAISSGDWSAVVDNTKLAALKAAGVNAIRVSFDSSGWLGGNATVRAQQISYIKIAVDQCVAAGINVLLDCHVQISNGSYTAAIIAADYLLWVGNNTLGPAYQAMQSLTTNMAVLCKGYSPKQVAYQLWNEIPTGTLTAVQWVAMMTNLLSLFRAQNIAQTIMVSGINYSGVDGLIAINPTGALLSDSKVVFCFTPYLPQSVTNQKLNDGWDLGWIGGTSPYQPAYWPRIFSDNTALKTSMHTAVDAWGGAYPQGSAAAENTLLDGVIDNLTKTGDGGTHAQDQTWLTAQLAQVVTWQGTYSIPSSRIMITEFGLHTSSETTPVNKKGLGPAADATTAALTSFIRRYAVAQGWGGMSWWHYDYDYFEQVDASYVLNDNILISLGRIPSRSYDTAANAIINAMSGLSSREQDLIYQFVKANEDSGAWAKIFSLYIKVAGVQANSLIDWENPATDANILAVHGGMTFTPYGSWHGNGTTGFLDATGNSLSGKLLQNNGCVGSYMGSSLTNATYGNFIPNDTNGNCFMNVASDYFVRMLDSNFAFASISPVAYNWRTGKGLGMADCSAAGGIDVYQNGALTGRTTDASTTPNYGGTLPDRERQLEIQAASGAMARLPDECYSACTMQLSLLQVCVNPDTRIGVHAATYVATEAFAPVATLEVWNSYARFPRFQDRVHRSGALQSTTPVYFSGADLHADGVPYCPAGVRARS
jgi:Cellulase (glycosyl hydrolase family 5)